MDEINKQREIVINARNIYFLEHRKLQKMIEEYQRQCTPHVWVRDELNYDPCRTLYVCEKCEKSR